MSTDHLPLPPGWVQYTSPDHIPFYFHQETNVSTWTHPAAPAPPQPPPPPTVETNQQRMDDYLTSPARTRAILETKRDRLRERLMIRDGMLQPDVADTVEAYCETCVEIGISINTAVEEVNKMLAENYMGSGDICAVLIDWLNLLKPTHGGQSAAKSHTCQMILQRVPHTQIEDVDSLLLKSEHAPSWLDALLRESEYRAMLVELSNQRKGSIFFECCVRAMAEKGFHDEVSKTTGTATAHYVIFLKTFCSIVHKLVDVISSPQPQPQQPSTTQKRSRTHDDYDTFARTEVELIKLIESAPHALALGHTILTTLEHRSDLPPQHRALCTRLRQRLKNPFPLSIHTSSQLTGGDNTTSGARAIMENMERLALEICTTEELDVCPLVVQLANLWWPSPDTQQQQRLTPAQHRSMIETLCDKRFLNRVMDSLFRPFRSQLATDARMICCRVVAAVVDLDGGIEPQPVLVDALNKASIICNSIGSTGGVPSQVHSLIPLVSKHATVAIASLIWANTILLSPIFQKSMIFFTGVTALCRLCEVISHEHPLQRQYVLSLLRCALDLRHMMEKRLVEYCELITDTMVRLACDGYVLPVLEYWMVKSDTYDASLLRSFLGGIMKRAKPPLSLEFKSKFMALVDSPAGQRAVVGGGIEFHDLKAAFVKL